MDAKLKDQELQMGIRDRKLARLIVQISTLQGELRSKATELRSSKTQLISQRQYIQEIIDKSQILRAENLGMKGELQEVDRLKKENDKQKERIVELTRYYKERGHLIQRLQTAQQSNKLLQQMLQKSVSTQCFPNVPSFPPTTQTSPANMPNFFSNMHSSLNKPLDPTASSFQPNLNPNARTFLPSDFSNREDRKRAEEIIPQMTRSISDLGITEKAKMGRKPASYRGWSRPTEKEMSMPRLERSVSQPGMGKHKELILEMKQKFTDAVDLKELQSADCLNDPLVNTRLSFKSQKKGEACLVNVEFDVITNPIHTNSLPEDIFFHPSFDPALQGQDQKPPPLPMDGNWDKWEQEMDPEMKFMQQQGRCKIEEQTTNSQKNDILVKTESTKQQQQLPGQQVNNGVRDSLHRPAKAFVPESSKYNSPSEPSEYLDFSIGTKTTGTVEKEVKIMSPHPENCIEKPLEEDCNERKQMSPEKAGTSVKPAKALENFSDGFLGGDKKRVSDEESEAKNEEGIPTVSPHKLVNRPIQHQKVVQKSMSEPIAEALVLVPEDNLTDNSKPSCHEETGNPATPALISSLERNIKQGSTTH